MAKVSLELHIFKDIVKSTQRLDTHGFTITEADLSDFDVNDIILACD